MSRKFFAENSLSHEVSSFSFFLANFSIYFFFPSFKLLTKQLKTIQTECLYRNSFKITKQISTISISNFSHSNARYTIPNSSRNFTNFKLYNLTPLLTVIKRNRKRGGREREREGIGGNIRRIRYYISSSILRGGCAESSMRALHYWFLAPRFHVYTFDRPMFPRFFTRCTVYRIKIKNVTDDSTHPLDEVA